MSLCRVWSLCASMCMFMYVYFYMWFTQSHFCWTFLDFFTFVVIAPCFFPSKIFCLSFFFHILSSQFMLLFSLFSLLSLLFLYSPLPIYFRYLRDCCLQNPIILFLHSGFLSTNTTYVTCSEILINPFYISDDKSHISIFISFQLVFSWWTELSITRHKFSPYSYIVNPKHHNTFFVKSFT